MDFITSDTSGLIAYKVTDLPRNFLLSAVVAAELTARAMDNTQRKAFEAMRRAAQKEDALIVPNVDDRLTAGRLVPKGGRKTGEDHRS